MNVHQKCPNCRERGREVQAQDGEALVCEHSGCRVVTFTEYLG